MNTAASRSLRIPRSASRVCAGFTLVEILASLLFLAIAVPAILGAFSVSSRTSEIAERGSLAGELAQNKLNELLTDSAWQNSAQANGDFGADFPAYHWQMTTQTWAGASVASNGGVGTGGTTGTTSTLGTGSNSSLNSSSATNGSTNTLTELDIEVFYPVQGGERSVRLATVVNPSLLTTATGNASGTSTTQ